jgi:hypothetical protein
MNEGLQYLKNTEHAVKLLFDAITEDRKESAEISKELGSILHRRWANNNRVSPEVHKLSPEIQMALWAKRSQELHAEERALNERASELNVRMNARQFSIGVLAGSVLQMAKQAISVQWKHWSKCKNGRPVYQPGVDPNELAASGEQPKGVPLAKAVWAARNQALHFEKKQMDNDDTLEVLKAFGLRHVQGETLAPTFLALLGWDRYEAYSQDMQLLMQQPAM